MIKDKIGVAALGIAATCSFRAICLAVPSPIMGGQQVGSVLRVDNLCAGALFRWRRWDRATGEIVGPRRFCDYRMRA